MSRITYTNCPCCGSPDIASGLTAKDHTVSRESFEIWQCSACTARFTQQVPDQSDIGAYYQSEDYISHSDTKKGLVNSLYHIVRKRTLRQKQQLVEQFTATKKGNLLDIGAGTGAFSAFMQKEGWNVVGLEPDDATRRRATQLHGIHLQSTSELFNLEPASFDAITMWHVLEHVHALHDYTLQVQKLLKPRGKAFIAVPNYTCYDAAVYGEYWAAYDVPRHLYHFSPLSMKLLVENFGMKLEKSLPMWYDSFYVSMLSEQYKSGHSNNARAFINGLLSNMKALGKPEKCSSVIYVIGK
jgi:SAM-dependent methyltransferase